MTKHTCKVDLTKPHISDYTEYEFFKIIDGLYEKRYGDEWQAEAEAMFTRVVQHPDGLALIDQHSYTPLIIDVIRQWYENNDLPFVQPHVARPITDYTEKEFLALLVAIYENKGTEEDQDDLAMLFDDAFDQLDCESFLFFPESENCKPEQAIEEIKQWYTQKGLLCFKPDTPV